MANDDNKKITSDDTKNGAKPDVEFIDEKEKETSTNTGATLDQIAATVDSTKPQSTKKVSIIDTDKNKKIDMVTPVDASKEIEKLEAQVEKEIGTIADTAIPDVHLTNFKKKVNDLQNLHEKVLSKMQNDEQDVHKGLETLKKLKEELGEDIKEIKELEHIDRQLQDEIKKIEELEMEIKKLEEDTKKELE